MISSSKEESLVNSGYHLTVNVWGGSVGHVSMEVHSEKGDDYLSLWPLESAGALDLPAKAVMNTFADDRRSEARRNRNELIRDPEGQYKLFLTKENSNAIYDQIQSIRKKINDGIINYRMVNQTLHDNQYTENYNCSGIVEKVLSDQLNIKQEENAVFSHPSRVANTMCSLSNVIIIKDDPIAHDPPSLQVRAGMESFISSETKYEAEFQQSVIRNRL